jgi:hypothetical protein
MGSALAIMLGVLLSSLSGALKNSKQAMHVRKVKMRVLAWAWGKIRKDSLGWGP